MRRYGRRIEVVPVVERPVEYDLFGKPVVKRLAHFPAGFILFSTISANTFNPFFVTVFAVCWQALAT